MDRREKLKQTAINELPSVSECEYDKITIPVFDSESLLYPFVRFEFEKEIINGIVIGWKLIGEK